MITVPSEEAGIPTQSDSRSSDSPAEGSQSQVSLPADGPAASGAASTEQQDVDPASIEPAASKVTAAFGDENQHEDESDAGHRQEPKEATAQLAHPSPDALQTSVSLQNVAWAGPVRDSRGTRNLQFSQSDSLVKEERPQTVGVPDKVKGLDPSTRSAEAQFLPNMPATKALPSAGSQAVTEEDLIDFSRDLRAPLDPPSMTCLPGTLTVALRGRHLDSSLYIACEDMACICSMTSLLAGAEGSISSLADILVCSEATMTMATGLLLSGHNYVIDLLPSPGHSLRSVSSILGNARLAFSFGLIVGTSLVLPTVNRMLERLEHTTVEGVYSVVCYMTSQLTHSSPNYD